MLRCGLNELRSLAASAVGRIRFMETKEKHEALTLTPRFTEAVDYARQIHTGPRKGTQVPYMAHLLGVASLVTGETGHVPFAVTEDMVIAALLHDAVEDAGGMPRLHDIEAKFGKEVADIVKGCTDSFEADSNRKGRWEQRKASYIKRLREETDGRLPQVKGAPAVTVSGLTGAGLNQLIEAVVEAHAVWNRRVPTSALNRFLAAVVAAHPPPAVAGRPVRLDYITQPKTRPPSFVLFASRADAVPDDYRRYLVNALRTAFDLPGTPIRLTLREKKNPFAKRASATVVDYGFTPGPFMYARHNTHRDFLQDDMH